MAIKKMRNAEISWIGNITTTKFMNSTHSCRKNHAEDNIPIPRTCKIKGDELDKSELIIDEYE